MQLAVRLPRATVEELDALVPLVHATRAAAVRAAVEAYLYRLACERDARRYEQQPLDEQELLLTDDPKGWQGTPAW